MRRATAVAAVAGAATAVATAVFIFAAVLPAAAQQQGTAGPPTAVTYQPPVFAPVTDGFRPPASPYGAGNRGVDYATETGMAVGAAAAGEVTFAGRIGSGLHVVVLHADGIRTSYSFLASVEVRRGDRVRAGQRLATSGTSLHFGARAGDAYVDPLVLLSGAGTALVRLVPDEQRAMGTEAGERSALRRFLGSVSGAVVGVGTTAVSWARGAAGAAATAMPSPERLRAWMAATTRVAVPRWLRAALTIRETWALQVGCTSPAVQAPVPAGRRRAVLVAGLGSSSEGASIDDVGTAALGYAPSDVVRFSYRGGTTEERPYGAADTQVDIRDSGRRLRDQLERMHASDPGVPIDVISHSQGGLVARVALGARAPPDVANLITLGSPHHGADLATVLAVTARLPLGAAAQAAAGALGVSGINPMSTSVRQLSETSGFIGEMEARPMPAGVRVTSIAARADIVVPSARTTLAGASNVVVVVPGLNDHSALPGSPAAQREMALALAGMAPTCKGLVDVAVDVVVGELISSAEDLAGLALVGMATP